VAEHLPHKVTEMRWVPSKMVPPYLAEASELLKDMAYKSLARKYVMPL
jgi:hypothetical protein